MKSNRKAKQILIVGSAGFIGRALMRKISQSGRSAYSLYHTHLPEPLNHITPVFADMLRPDQLDTYVKQADEIVYLAWSNSFKSMKNVSTPTNDAPNISMLRNLVASMEQHGSRRLIFMSSLGASRFADSYFLKEKYAAENVVINSSIPEKLVLRSSLVYSDLSAKDKFTQSIERLMAMPWFYPVPRFEHKIAPLHVDDLVDVLIKLIDAPLVTSTQLLEISGDENLALSEIFRAVSQGIGKSHHIALKGFIGDALTPLFEKLHGSKRLEGPSLRDLLTVAVHKDETGDAKSPLIERALPSTHRFDEAMGKPRSALLN